MSGSIHDRSLSTLTSPGFLAALFLLLLNDFFLKSYLHNALTGKLSDFAGLFVFPLFWATLFPRARSWIYFGTVVFFAFWKSHASQGLIENWNSIGLLSIGRTVDYSDLWALAVLPFSYVYGLRGRVVRWSRTFPALVGCVSVFAFAATSFSHQTKYDNPFYFPMSKQELLERMGQLSKEEDKSNLESARRHYSQSERFTVDIDCTYAKFTLVEKENQTVLILTETNFRCPSPPSKEETLRRFEQEFVERLRETPVRRSSSVGTVWGDPDFRSPPPTSLPHNQSKS
ncbi:MAG: hypothetical protein WAQ99_18670 [Pyrinomonadaceae bacterium]